MTGFSASPRIMKGGIVLLDPESSVIQNIISLQYNPEQLSRSLQVRGTSSEAGDRSESLRLIGPPVETIKLDAEIDATDQLEYPADNPNAVEFGIHPQLAALESLIYPHSSQLIANDALARSGTLEIIPMESSLSLFIWSKHRILPVRITDFSVTEEAFDPSLNPVRAKVSLGMRVLSVDDLGFDHMGSNLYMGYLQGKEMLKDKMSSGSLGSFGIEQI